MNHRTYLLANVIVLSMLAGILNVAFASESANAVEGGAPAEIREVDGTYILDDLVVSRKGKLLSGVTYESDGSLSVNSASLFTIYKALSSDIGAPVNFKVAFAKNSIVMNADGGDQLDKMAKALTYMDEGSRFELIVQKGSSQPASSKRKNLEERRVQEILFKLRQRYKLSHAISVKYVQSQKRPTNAEYKTKAYQTLAMTMVSLK